MAIEAVQRILAARPIHLFACFNYIFDSSGEELYFDVGLIILYLYLQTVTYMKWNEKIRFAFQEGNEAKP